MAYLEVKDVIANYPDFELDLSFTLDKGEFLSIIGPSGSGKSTLLYILSGILPISNGTIILNNEDITNKDIQKRNIGLVFQDYALFPHLNVEKNIAYSLNVQKVDRKTIKNEVNRLLGLVNLSGYNNRRIDTLSGGEKQRVALARSLASKPDVLLLDEPLSALDAKLRRSLRNEIRRIHDEAGLTTIYVTHDREEAFSISDKIIVMDKGKKSAEGTAEDIYRRSPTLSTAFFTGEGTTLPSNLFELDESCDTIFFRPEDVLVNFEATNAKPSGHLALKDCDVVASEFTGSSYLIGLLYKGYPILALSKEKPQKSKASLWIPLWNIAFYKDKQLIQ